MLSFACPAGGGGIHNERPACCLLFKELSAVAFRFGLPRLARFGKRKNPGRSPHLTGQAQGFEGDFGRIRVHRRETWGYVQTSQRGFETGFSPYPKFAIPCSCANGGSGELRKCSARLSVSAVPWMPIRSGRETPIPGAPMSRLFELCPARHTLPPSPMTSFRFRSTG